MPVTNLSAYDSALPELERDGLVPSGADADTAVQALRAKMDAEGVDTNHPETQAVLAGVRSSLIRRSVATKRYDPSLLAASGLEGFGPDEARRRYEGMQDPEMQAQMASVTARSQGPYSSMMEGVKRSVGTALGGLAGNVGSWTGSQTLQEIGTQQRMLAEQAEATTDSPTAYHVGAMGGSIAPMLAGPAGVAGTMAGTGMSALQAQDVGAFGQTVGGATLGAAGLVLPAVTGKALGSAATGIVSKLGMSTAGKTAVEVVGAKPTVGMIAGGVVIKLAEGAGQFPGMVAGNMLGTAAGFTADGRPMEGLRRAWEERQAMGDPIGWLEFAALHTAMAARGGKDVRNSFGDPNAEGTPGQKLRAPFVQPYEQARVAYQEGNQRALAEESRRLQLTEEALRQQEAVTAESQRRAQEAEEAASYQPQMEAGERVLTEEARRAEADRVLTQDAMAEDAFRGGRVEAERKYADLRKQADDELAARELEAERIAARDKFAQEELEREAAAKAEAESYPRRVRLAEQESQPYPEEPKPFVPRPEPEELRAPITPAFGKATPTPSEREALLSKWLEANPSSPEGGAEPAPVSGVKPAALSKLVRAVAPDAPVVENPKAPLASNPPFSEPTAPEKRFPKSLVATSGEEHPLGKGKLDTVPTPEAEKLGRELAPMHPAFQGNKANIQTHTFTALQKRWTPEQRSKITHLDERFAGGGGYGLSVASSGLLPNLKKITVRELNPVRAAKIKWIYDHGERFNQIVQDNAAQIGNVLERMYFQAKEDGASTASMSAVIARLRRFMDTAEGQALSEDARQVLAHWAEAGRGHENWVDHMNSMAKSAVSQARAAKAFRAKGGEIEVVQGDSYATPAEPGRHLLMLADPPYVHTKGYGESVVSGDTYEKTHQLLRGAADAGNHIIYHDSAWMAREPGDTMHDIAAGDLHRSFRTLRNIGGVLPDMNVVNARTQSEVLGVRNAESSPTPRPVEREGTSGGRSGPTTGSPTPVGAGTPGSKPVEPAKPVIDRTVTDAHRSDAKSLAPLIGHDAEVRVNDNGSVTFTGKQGKVTITYEDKTLPAEQVNRRAWFNSLMGDNRAAGLKNLSEMLKVATLEQTAVRAATKDKGGDDFAVKVLEKLKPEDWKRLYDQYPIAGRTMRDENAGADMGALVAIQRSLSGTEGGADVLREEYGHHLWAAMTTHAPDLVNRILKTETSPAERDAIFNPDGSLRDANRAMEIGTAKVNRALNRREAEAIKRGPPSTGFLASVWRFLSKFLPKSLTQDPALRPSEEAAKMWAEGKIRPEYAGKPGEGYAVRKLKPEAGSTAGAQQSIRRSMAEEARQEAGGAENLDDIIARAEAGLADTARWMEVSNKIADGKPLTVDETLMARFQSQDLIERAAERGGIAAYRDLKGGLDAAKAVQVETTDAAKKLRQVQLDVNRESDVTRIIKEALYRNRNEYWERRLREAGEDEMAQAKVGDDYARDQKMIVSTVRNKYGVDITRPDIGNLFKGDAYGVRALEREIRLATPMERGDAVKDWWNTRFSFGGLFAEITRNSILNFSSGIPQAAGAAMFGVKSVGKRLTDSLITALNKDAQQVGGFEGSGQVLRETASNLYEAVGIAKDMMLTGRSVAHEQLTGKRAKNTLNDETASSENDLPILHSERHRYLSAAARSAIGPGAAITGFVDEMVWATTFRQHQTFAAARKRALGDQRELAEIKNDADIKENAEKEADFVTMRGGYHGPFAKQAEALGALRQPTYRIKVGDKYHVHTSWGVLGYPLLPIYKSVMKALSEAAVTANLPGNLMALGRGFQGKAAAEKSSIATGKTVEAIMEERHRMAVEAGGRIMMAALAGTIGTLWANAPQQGKDALLKESAKPQGAIGDIPASRFSPYYEITQLGAIGRQAAEEWGSKGGKMVVNDALLSSYDAFINRPLLTGLQAFARKSTDPETGAPLTFMDKAGKVLQDETALGRPYIDLVRKATESEAKATTNYFERNYALKRESKVDQLSGEARDKGGFVRQMVFGGESMPSPKERELIQRIVRVNDALFKQAGDNVVKQENAIWVPSRVDAVLHEDKVLGQQWRMNPEELRVAQKVAGQHFSKMMESMPEDPNPAVMQIRMRAAWGQATALARAVGTRMAMPRIIAEREKLMAQR